MYFENLSAQIESARVGGGGLGGGGEDDEGIFESLSPRSTCREVHTYVARREL